MSSGATAAAANDRQRSTDESLGEKRYVAAGDPSPEEDPFPDFRDRAMFLQAWSSYGTQWPVISNFLGIAPDVPAGELTVVPDVPDSWAGLAVHDLRVGADRLDASASRDGGSYTTRVEAPRGLSLTIGHVLPRDATPTEVRLDGEQVGYRQTQTDRGLEVTVDASGGGHTLTVTGE